MHNILLAIFLISCVHVAWCDEEEYINFAKKGQFPWTVYINILQSQDVNFDCAGALVKPEFVLTSAVCFPTIPIKKVKVYMGFVEAFFVEYEVDNTLPNVRQFVVVVPKDIFVHPCYKHSSSQASNRFDIALLAIPSINHYISTYISTIILPQLYYIKTPDNYTPNEHFQVVSWLVPPKTLTSSWKSQMVYFDVDFLPDETCNVITNDIKTAIVYYHNICAQERKANCLHIMNGGPLIGFKKQTPFLAGVYQKIDKCRESMGPNLLQFTRVTSHLLWLVDTMKVYQMANKSISRLKFKCEPSDVHHLVDQNSNSAMVLGNIVLFIPLFAIDVFSHIFHIC